MATTHGKPNQPKNTEPKSDPKGPTPSTTPTEPLKRETPEAFEKRQEAVEQVEANPDKGGFTPTDEEKAQPGNHPEPGDKPHPDHADQPPAGSGNTGGERDGRGEVFDQDRSPKGVDYAGARGPNTDVYSGSDDDRRNA